MDRIDTFKIRQIAGFTLIEVLVALLILAVGLLGIAALQFKTLRYSNDAFIRSQISFLAYDIADRIRGNSTLAADYVGSYTVPVATGKNACVYSKGLEDSTNAANDLGCWRNNVDASLPTGSTAKIEATNNLYTVTLSWTDHEKVKHSIGYSFQP